MSLRICHRCKDLYNTAPEEEREEDRERGRLIGLLWMLAFCSFAAGVAVGMVVFVFIKGLMP